MDFSWFYDCLVMFARVFRDFPACVFCLSGAIVCTCVYIAKYICTIRG